MKCEKCNNRFPVGKHKVMVYSNFEKRLIYFCSEKCLEEFEKGYPSDQLIRTDEEEMK